MSTVANLGIKVSSEGIESTEKALNKLSDSSSKSEKAIDRMIESIKKQNIILQAGKAAFADYSLIALGASESERKLAADIIKSTESIKAARKSEADQLKKNMAESKAGNLEQIKELKDVEKAEKARATSIQNIIEALNKEEKALKMSKAEQSKYNLSLLGASDAEKKLAQDIIDRIASIKAEKKAEIDAQKAINESKIAKERIIEADKKRRDSINTTIMKLRDEVAILGKSDSELLRYKLTLLGATDAEKKQALALQKTIKEYKEANAAANKHDSALMSLAKRVSAIALAYAGIRSIKNFGTSLVDTALIADNYKYSLQAVSDTNKIAAESYSYLKKESERLGLSITGQADSFVSFAASAKAAGMTVDETRSAYTGLSEAIAAMHRSPEQASAALKSLEQMLGKGTVQSEELVRQLSNALPGAVPLFAKAMGVSVSSLKDLMKKGLLPATDAVKAFTNFLSNDFQKAAEEASKGTQGSLNKIGNAIYELKEAIVKSLGEEGIGVISAFTEEIKRITTQLSTPEGQAALKEFADGISAIAKAAIWAGGAIASMASNYNETTRAAKIVSELNKKVIEAEKTDKSYTATFAIDQEQRKKNAEENLRITGEQLELDKKRIQKILEASNLEKESSAEKKANAKALKKLQEESLKLDQQMGKTDAEKAKMDAISLGATEKEADAIYELVKSADAKKAAIKAGIEAEQKAISEREKIRKQEEALEEARQGRIDKVIEKLKEEIATYKKGDEVSAEYALRQDNATEKELLLAESLGKTLDSLKEKTKAQEEYNKVMDKVAPDKVELNREKSILAVNSAMEAGIDISIGYKASIEKINSYFDNIEDTKADKRLNDIGKELDSLTSFDGSTFGNTIADGINNAVTSMNNLLEVYDKNAKAQKEIKKLQDELATGEGSPEVRAEKLKDIDKYETAMIKNQISGYRELFGTTSQLFEENTKERKALHTAEMAFAAVEIAMNTTKAISLGVVAVINAMSAGDPYTAVARGLAVAATVAAALSQIGGMFSMGDGGSSSEPVKATNQTGTVLGDSTASSESLQNIEDFFEDMHVEDYTQLKGIYSEVKDLNKNITGLVSSLYSGDNGEFTAESMGIDTGEMIGASEELFRELFGLNIISDSILGDISRLFDPIGTYVTGWLGDLGSSVIGKIFGGGSESSVEAQGLSTANEVEIGELLSGTIIDAIKFADIKTEIDGGWLHSDKTEYSRKTEDLGSEFDNLFTQVFSSLGESFVDISEILGRDVETVQDYVFQIGDIDLKNLETADEINEALSAAISTISDEAATELFGELIGQYQTVGEGMLETAIRVASEKVVVIETVDKLGNAFENADVPSLAIEFSQSLIDIAGDLETFMEISNQYYEDFFSDAEKQAYTYKYLTESLGNIGFEIPDTSAFYRDLVDGIDRTTESGQNAYITLLTLSETADEYYSYLEDIEEKRFDYEIEILELEGMASEALTLSRKKELEAIEESLQPLQERVWALQDESDSLSALESAKSDYLERLKSELSVLENNLNDAKSEYVSRLEEELSLLEGNLDTAKSNYISKLQEEESALSENLSDAKSTYIEMLNEEATTMDNLVSSIKSAIESIQDYSDSLFDVSDVSSLSKDYLLSRQVSLAGSVSSGNIDDVSELISISGQYLDVAKDTSKTSIDYKREVAKTNALLYGVQGSLNEQLTDAEISAKAFQDLISGINKADNDILTIAQAETLYNEAKTEFENNKFSEELKQFEEIKTFEEIKAAYYIAKSELDNNWYEKELAQFEKESGIEELRTAYYDAKLELDNNWYSAEIDALSEIETTLIDLKNAFYSAQTQVIYTDSAGGGADSSSESTGVSSAVQYLINNPDVMAESQTTGFLSANGFSSAADYAQWHYNTYGKDEGRAFAEGGYNPGGLTLVGEKGPELSYRPPSQIMSNSDMMKELSNKEVVAELKQLRDELARANFAIAKNTLASAKTLNKFDYDGMPPSRDEVTA